MQLYIILNLEQSYSRTDSYSQNNTPPDNARFYVCRIRGAVFLRMAPATPKAFIKMLVMLISKILHRNDGNKRKKGITEFLENLVMPFYRD